MAFTVTEKVAGATDSIRVVLQAETLEYTLDGKSKQSEHRPSQRFVSPDGEWTIRENEAGIVRRLTVEPVGGGQARPLPGPDGNEFSWSWSPDSKRIAYVVWQGKKGEIHLIDVDGSNDQQITDSQFGASGPSFGPDGSLAYVVWRGGIGKGRHSDLVIRGGKEVKTILSDEYVGGFMWSPDGKTLAISKIGELIFYDFGQKDKQQSIKLTDIDAGLGGHMRITLPGVPKATAWRAASSLSAVASEVLACQATTMYLSSHETESRIHSRLALPTAAAQSRKMVFRSPCMGWSGFAVK